jgi:hypothetical protein
MIAKWHGHLLRLALVTRLPFVDALRRIKRSMVGYEPNASNIGLTFYDLQILYDLIRKSQVYFHGTILEIGSGWFPIAGIVARLAGAERVILTDITPLMDQGTFLTAKRIVFDRIDKLATAFDFDSAEAYSLLRDASSLNDLDLTYLAPFDIAAIADASLDFVISRACLEHIPVSSLTDLLALLKPKLKVSGVMAHAIDNSDHFSHADPTISRVNFLTWTEAKHRLIWQLARGGENRLRHHEYADLFGRAGYKVVGVDAFIHDKVIQELRSLALSAPYKQMTEEQIAAVTSWYVLRPL